MYTNQKYRPDVNNKKTREIWNGKPKAGVKNKGKKEEYRKATQLRNTSPT